MSMQTWDTKANKPENILDAVESIGNSIYRKQVFEAVYHHKQRAKTIQEIRQRTGLTRMQVLQAGGHLRADEIIGQDKVKGETVYIQIPFYQRHKKKILRLVADKSKAEKISTKRNVKHIVEVKQPKASRMPKTPQHHQIHIDDIDSFKKVKKVRSKTSSLPDSMTERQFNDGVKAILGDTGIFKDWGGENSDMLSSRMLLNGTRKMVAFGFKGPGLKSALTIAKMGKNGNQMLRLFKEPAQVFIVQHWREIKPDVLELMELCAERKARAIGKPVWFCLIDGHDSNRLRLAYSSYFKIKK